MISSNQSLGHIITKNVCNFHLQAVKPLLHERTRKKVQVLQGSGGDELLKVVKNLIRLNKHGLSLVSFSVKIYILLVDPSQIMDQASLPHFCRRENSRSSHNSSRVSDCFSLDHPFHQQLYSYVKQQQSQIHHYKVPTKQGSYHFSMPNADSDGAIIVETIKSALKEQR